MHWGQRQARRAEGAEQTLAEAVSRLQNTPSDTPTDTDGAVPHPRAPRTTARIDEPGSAATEARTRATRDPHPNTPRPTTPKRATPAPPRVERGTIHTPGRAPRTPPIPPAPPTRRAARVNLLDDRLAAIAVAGLVDGSRWDRLRGRRTEWWTLLPGTLGAESWHIRHAVLAGPPGVFTLSTLRHRGGEIVVDGPRVLVDGQESTEAAEALAEAHRVGTLLRQTLAARDRLSGSLDELTVRPVLTAVGARSLRTQQPGPTIVTSPATLTPYLRALPTRLTATELGVLAELGRQL
ncbi:MAG TPA: hypothetical protein VGH89_23760 [Pseudonocardia sp.]